MVKREVPHTTALPYQEGWGPLFEACATTIDRNVFAVSAGSSVDVRPYAKACDAAGLGPLPRTALEWLSSQASPRIVSWREVQQKLDQAARILNGLMSAKGSFVFALDGRLDKSNTWIFLLLMKRLQQLNKGDAWNGVRSRVWTTTSKAWNSKGRKPPKPWTMVFADDCAYSGQQMSSNVSSVLRENDAGMQTIVMLMYATDQGAKVVSAAAPAGTSMYVSNTLPSVPDAPVLLLNDVALCVQHSSDAKRWIVTTLFSILQLVSYNVRNHRKNKQDKSLFKVLGSGINWEQDCIVGESIHVTATPSSPSMVAFEHKLPDSVSIPFSWFLVGPTLRTFIARTCQAAPCDLSAKGVQALRLATAPWLNVLKALNRKDAKYGGVQLSTGHDFQRAFVIHDDDLRAVDELQILPKSTKIDALPFFVPLLQPDTACGTVLDAARKQVISDSEAWSGVAATQQTTQSMELPCVLSPYKTVLRKAGKLPEVARMAAMFQEL